MEDAVETFVLLVDGKVCELADESLAVIDRAVVLLAGVVAEEIEVLFAEADDMLESLVLVALIGGAMIA